MPRTKTIINSYELTNLFRSEYYIKYLKQEVANRVRGMIYTL